MSDFSALQEDFGGAERPVPASMLFDLLYLDGKDLRGCRSVERKARLAALLAGATEPLGSANISTEDGELMLRHACRLSLEGIVSKRRDAPYPLGRGKDWIKSKCSDRQEFVIAGYVPSTAAPKAVGSLVLGYHARGQARACRPGRHRLHPVVGARSVRSGWSRWRRTRCAVRARS